MDKGDVKDRTQQHRTLHVGFRALRSWILTFVFDYNHKFGNGFCVNCNCSLALERIVEQFCSLPCQEVWTPKINDSKLVIVINSWIQMAPRWFEFKFWNAIRHNWKWIRNPEIGPIYLDFFSLHLSLFEHPMLSPNRSDSMFCSWTLLERRWYGELLINILINKY